MKVKNFYELDWTSLRTEYLHECTAHEAPVDEADWDAVYRQMEYDFGSMPRKMQQDLLYGYALRRKSNV